MTDASTDPLPLDEQLCFSLYGASIAMNRAYKPLLDAIGITYPQYLVLHVLWERDGRTIGAIADRLALESSTITPLVKRLEGAGMVTRARDPGDERQVRVTLTPEGAGLRAQANCVSETVSAQTRMTMETLRALTRQINTLRAALVETTQG